MSIRPTGNHQDSTKVGLGNLRISSDYLILLLEFGIELGLKQSDLLLESGLGADILIRPSISIGHISFLQVVSNFIALKPDLSLAVAYGKRMTLSKHGALGIAARHSRTTDDAASTVTAYMRTRAEIFSIKRERDDDNRRLYADLEVEPSPAVYFMALAYLTSIEFIIRQMLAYPDEILTRIDLPITCTTWKQAVLAASRVPLDDKAPGASIHFGSKECALLWPRAFLNDLLPLFDKELVLMAEEVCETEMESIAKSASIKQVIEIEFKNSTGSLPTIESLALKLNMSAATLKRRMKVEGVSFRGIKDDVLYKRAVRLLTESTLSVEAIAEQLGYSDASNFSKAFKSWSDCSPTEFRQR